ncbi:MAG: transposase domain-containing protein [Faecalibacterium prausnitzii]
MIETAKRNGLDPFGYLLFLLQELPKLGKPPAEEPLERIFPWSNTIPVYRHLT